MEKGRIRQDLEKSLFGTWPRATTSAGVPEPIVLRFSRTMCEAVRARQAEPPPTLTRGNGPQAFRGMGCQTERPRAGKCFAHAQRGKRRRWPVAHFNFTPQTEQAGARHNRRSPSTRRKWFASHDLPSARATGRPSLRKTNRGQALERVPGRRKQPVDSCSYRPGALRCTKVCHKTASNRWAHRREHRSRRWDTSLHRNIHRAAARPHPRLTTIVVSSTPSFSS